MKRRIWEETWSSFFTTPFTVELLEKALYKLVFPQVKESHTLPPAVYIAHILLAMWRSHFHFMFNEQPFLPSIVIAHARSLLLTSFREKLVRDGMSPFPIPHFNLP
ncbi:hypothetical protein INT48_003601 [Thamnidium elegans]|uniref:Uncharacterized protein n=1 Tax=Thamnidium elegans TaxID=101142 RepID=A0A8H7SED4_9FUNG|nr:hypothetical protein INT48_003601 [Thamnidium elegans]